MICPGCYESHMRDYGEYYQCPQCGDIQVKCQSDRGMERFKKACLSKRQPTPWERVKTFLITYRMPITYGLLLSFMIYGLMVLQMGGRGL